MKVLPGVTKQRRQGVPRNTGYTLDSPRSFLKKVSEKKIMEKKNPRVQPHPRPIRLEFLGVGPGVGML